MRKSPVSTQKEMDLAARMRKLGLRECDYVETHLSQGGIALSHPASGIVVRVRRERRQSLNRFLARRILVEELEARLEGKTRREVKAEELREKKLRAARVRPSKKFNVAQAMSRLVVGAVGGIAPPRSLPELGPPE